MLIRPFIALPRLTAALAVPAALLALGSLGACGGGDDDSSGTAGTSGSAGTPKNGDYFSCDTVSGEGMTTGMHTCLEVTEKGIYLPSVMQDCVGATEGYTGTPGYGFSTTKHCSQTVPGCVCSYTEGGGDYEAYTYATETTTNPRENTQAYCDSVGGGTVSCFGGAQ